MLTTQRFLRCVRRLRNGMAQLRYAGIYPTGSGHEYRGILGATEAELDHFHWNIHLHHPFDPYARNEFMYQLITHMRYTKNEDGPDTFKVPGVWVDDGPRRYYKREDSVSTPDVKAVSELTAAGWATGHPAWPT